MRDQIHLSMVVICFASTFLAACSPQAEEQAVPEPVFDQAAEEAAIREANEQRLALWNAKDVKTYLTFFDEECTNGWEGGPCARPLREKGEFPETTKNAKQEIIEEIGVAFITPDVAIYRYIVEMSGQVDAEGKPRPPARDQEARVYVKKNGKWLVAVYGLGRAVEE